MEHRSYTVLLEPDPDVGGFTATVPAVPEIATEGDDETHALAMAREAIEIYLRHAAEIGIPGGAERMPFRLAAVEVDVPTAAAAGSAWRGKLLPLRPAVLLLPSRVTGSALRKTRE